MVKIKHLQQIHDLKSYRNACRIVKQLGPYVNETYYMKEKVIYLNKHGRELIGSTKEDNKKHLMAHTFLRNEVFIYFKCPHDWKNEHLLETILVPENSFGIQFKHVNLGTKKKVISDASFKRNGYLHLIEVDNARKMIDNKKKIETYKEVLPAFKEQTPILYFFTTTEDRKRKLKEQLQGVRNQVFTFKDIR
ncbi:hypothetical protein [Cytobacillus praedii]|uniref:hypothetical protein n=1 Tax=Cytobacillus praedii TaxID=1742358 RepID=UPI002E1C8D60|nr:hypothetical protein [Cytobacillus praedii]